MIQIEAFPQGAALPIWPPAFAALQALAQASAEAADRLLADEG